MSLTNYKIFKITDKNVQFELQVNSHNDQDFKCQVKFEQEMNLDGYPPFVVKPVCMCDTSDNKVYVTSDVLYEIIENDMDESFQLEDPFIHLDDKDEDTEDENEPIPDSSEEEVAEVSEEVAEVLEEVSKEVAEVSKEVADVSEEVAEVAEEVSEEVAEVSEEVAQVVAEEVAKEVVEEILNEIVSEIKEDEQEINSKEKLSEIFISFNKHIENLINRLDTIDNYDNKPKKIHHAPKFSLVDERSLIPDEQPPTLSQENKPHPPTTPPQEKKPRPPTTTPPIKLENKSQQPPPTESKLNEKIIALQKLYFMTEEDIESILVQIIIDHMRCIEQYHISGDEKKNIVISSIETILMNNEAKNISSLTKLSSQLIDTFIALDKNKIKIQQKPSALSCFVCK